MHIPIIGSKNNSKLCQTELAPFSEKPNSLTPLSINYIYILMPGAFSHVGTENDFLWPLLRWI